jgi:hypothetical protein
MRDQSNELLQIAKELRDYVILLNLPEDVNKEGKSIGINITISNGIRIHYSPFYSYTSIDFSWPNEVSVRLFENAGINKNTVTINVESVSDKALDLIIQIAQTEIDTFKILNPIKELNETCM